MKLMNKEELLICMIFNYDYHYQVCLFEVFVNRMGIIDSL